MHNDYYIYNEYDNLCGRYELRTNITEIFETLEELFEFMENRKEYWKSFWNTRTVKIDIIKKGDN